MESQGSVTSSVVSRLELRLLGPPTVLRDGLPVALPPSRKVRALLGYLAVASRPVSRERLCDLLWEVPNDPRGELRWSLSKLRAVLDTADRHRVRTENDRVSLDLSDCATDVIDVARAMEQGISGLTLDELRMVAASYGGEFLEGLEIGHSADFGHWLAGQRSRLRSHRVAIAAELGRRTLTGEPAALAAARGWVDLAPLDPDAHGRLLEEFAHRHMLDECDRHLVATAALFKAEGTSFAPVEEAWRQMRLRYFTPAAAITEAAEDRSNPASGHEGMHRASVAVMPFREERVGAGRQGALGKGLTHDVITRLAKLRSLFVIARGSVFALAEESLSAGEIGRKLGVRYLATGSLRQEADGLVVSAELVEAETSRIVWTETFERHSDDAFAILDEIGDSIVAAIAAEIEMAERNRAILKPPNSLDAWEAYHRGLWHMYRFTREENERAADFFRRSVQLDPTFSRAHAGLSFTHWQNAFQRWGERADETRFALQAAGQSLIVDEHNPAAHWSMGRAMWLAGDPDEAVRELELSVHLSPNFALGHYSLSFVQSQSGDPEAAIRSSDHSRLLSPYDPLLFGMLGARAMAHVRLGAFDEAAEWALKAAARPNAHSIILAIAAHCLALAGRLDEAQSFVARMNVQHPGYRSSDFLETFRFAPDAAARFREAAARIGLQA